MIDVAVSEGAVTAVDVEKNEVTVRVDGWAPSAEAPRLERRVDATITGATRGVAFPKAAVSIESDAASGWRVVDDRTGPFELAAGDHLFKVGTTFDIYLAASGACRVSPNRDETFAIEFDRRTPVTVGFRSQVDRPRETLTVPRTLEGVVEAIRYQSAAIETDTPDRSYPTRRFHPPLVAFGPDLDIPDAVRRDTTFSGITVTVPPSVAQLLVAAPLVYYLQADVRLAPVETVRVEAPSLDDAISLGGRTLLERDVAGLLQHVFFLDCLVRNAGPYGVDLRELDLLDELAIDMDDLYHRPSEERFARYLEANPSRVAASRPEWHLSFVVDPSLSNVRAIPYLLDRLSLVERPRPAVVGRQTVITESVRRSYRSRSGAPADAPAYELVRNEVRLGAEQGWLADGIPVDGFRASLAAFENRLRFHSRSEGPRTVVVVINDDAMGDERTGVERIYQSRAAELAIDVTVEEGLTREALADVLASPVDFLHYIGHCEPAGLECTDGTLSVADVDETRVQTFFLNACGSYAQGHALIDRGSVAGAATLHNVLNPEATRVGLTFARLVMHGFSVNHALSLASRQSLTNKFYVVVGDGTHRLAQGEDTFPAVVTADRCSPDAFEVRFSFPQSTIPGGLAKPAVPGEAAYVLRGRPYVATLPAETFLGYLRDVNIPVIYDNEFHWSTALAARLGSRRRAEPVE